LYVWDTAGQERFRTITTSYYRGAHGIIIVYDITEEDSFNNVTTWLQEIEKKSKGDTARLLLGNKADLEGKRAIPTPVAKKFADSMELMFFEASAKDCINVDTAFMSLVQNIYHKAKEQSSTQAALSQQLTIQREVPPEAATSSWCCRT